MKSSAPLQAVRSMPGWLATFVACFGLLLAASATFAATNGSSRNLGPHRGSDEACPVCHTPRHAGATAPAWNHAFADGTYPLYADDTLAPNEPGAATKVCLSCHDGTLATGVMSERWRGPGSGLASLSRGMHMDSHGSGGHPVGIDYAVARDDGRSALADPMTLAVTIGSTRTLSGNLLETLLTGGRVECTSCHDAHNTYTVGDRGLTKAHRDTVCLSCHQM